MGNFVVLNNSLNKRYLAIDKKCFANLFACEQKLKFYSFKQVGSVRACEVYFDTPNNLLENAGLSVCKISEGNNHFFKVEQIKKTSSLIKNKVFVHKVGAKDKLCDHAFYLTDGLKGLFSLSLSIDVENVIKNAVPKISVSYETSVFKVVSGSGFRCYLCLENILFNNFTTKRKEEKQAVLFKNQNLDGYENEFEKFVAEIEKNVKNFVLLEENTYKYAQKITKAIDKKQAKKDAVAMKAKILENKKLD